jgi:hypothetical protein
MKFLLLICIIFFTTGLGITRDVESNNRCQNKISWNELFSQLQSFKDDGNLAGLPSFKNCTPELRGEIPKNFDQILLKAVLQSIYWKASMKTLEKSLSPNYELKLNWLRTLCLSKFPEHCGLWLKHREKLIAETPL